MDTLNYYGYRNAVWNGFTPDEHLGRLWNVAVADKYPPVISRGALVDVPVALGLDALRDSIGVEELEGALRRQQTELWPCGVVLVRTGRMTVWPDPLAHLYDSAGLTQAGAEFLAKFWAITIGADNIAIEQQPVADAETWPPVHTFLLVGAGIPMIEVLKLEMLAVENVQELAYIGADLKLQVAIAAPIRPITVPQRHG